MTEQSPTAPQDAVFLDLPGIRWPDWRWLALLFVLTAGMRAWQFCNTEVTSRDSIAYIRYALRLEKEPWLDVIRTSEHHPGYPFAIYLVAKPIRDRMPDDLPGAMQKSAQLVSCIASLLLIFPMFYIGRELFDGRVGFWGALFYQCLPAPGRVLADGLSDPLFLLLAAWSVWLAMIALRKARPGWFFLVGLTSALAYLTRTEGSMAPAAVSAVLVGLQASKRWRQPWRRVGWNFAGLAAGTALLAAPFMILIGGVSLKPGVRILIGTLAATAPANQEHSALTVAALPLAMWNFGPDIHPEDRYGWAAWAVLVELSKGFFHLLGLPALLGLILYRRRFTEVPGVWVMLVSGVALVLLLYRLGQANGYVGERHVLLIVMGGVYFAVLGLVRLGGWLAWVLARCCPGVPAGALSLLILAGMAVAPLPRTLARLHADRQGFRQAGLWLAAHTRPEDRVIDPFALAAYQSGRVSLPASSVKEPGVYYVVLEESRNPHAHLYYLIDPAKKLVRDHHGKKVESFPMRQKKTSNARIVVYRVQM